MLAIEKLKRIVSESENEPIESPMKLAFDIQSYAHEIGKELSEVTAPYGRFLISQNKNVTIQLHLHSPQYEGSIHDHGTWGIMLSLKGKFVLEDWMVKSVQDSFLLRKYIIPQFGLVHFPYRDGFDWHKNTNRENFRSMSLHIYGPNYNNEKSRIYLSDTNSIKTHSGMELKNIINILPQKP